MAKKKVFKCLVCGKQGFMYPSAPRKFCSLSCSGKMGGRKKGSLPWNKGIKRTDILGEKNGRWMGDKVSYSALHLWIRKVLGTPNRCDECGNTQKTHYDWANISHEYKRDLTDWKRLCRVCHYRYDRVESKGKIYA